MEGDKTAEIQKSMVDYLKNTYEKDFIVDKPVSKSNTGFGYIQHIANAYSKDQKDLKIVVTWNKNTGEYSDTYLATKWTMQGKQEMEKKLKAVYGDNFGIDVYKLYFNDKSLKNLNYNDIINKYAYRMRIDFDYYVFLDRDLDKKYEAERAYKLLKENLMDIDSTRGVQYSFGVVYVKKGKKAAFEEVYKNTKEGDGQRSAEDLHKLGIVENWLGLLYTPSLKDKYPEVKNAVEMISEFRI